MRPTAYVGVAIALLASHSFAADPGVYVANVTDAEVLLRAGPSDAFPDTGSLKRGAQVIVEREENGWLAVSAPHGSVSWIAFSFVEDLAPDRQTPKNGLVHAEGDVTIAAGKAGVAQPLDVRREKVPNGTQVLLIGPAVEFSGKKWWPIAPPAGDVRYLPKTAVQFDKAVNNNATVRVTDTSGTPPAAALPPPAPTAAPLATIPGPGGTTPAGGVTASKPAVNHPLWTQAETAEREGRLVDAEKAYFELAAIMNGPDGDRTIANLCFTRIQLIREKLRNTSGSTTKSNTNASVPPTPPKEKEERGVRLGTPTALPAAASTNNGNPNTSDNRGQWYGPGILKRSNLTPDGTGKQAYALVPSPAAPPIAYVIAGPGIDLEKFRDKRVDVFGVSHPTKLSKPFIVVTNVEPASKE
jgi:hypothetical protein